MGCRWSKKVSEAARKMESEIRSKTSPNWAIPAGPLWLIGISLSVLAFSQVMRMDGTTTARAQSTGQAGARGVFAFSGQLTEKSYGLFMVDVDTMTIWCYEYLSGAKELTLVAGRSWIHDRYLKNFNAGDLSPADVDHIVQQEREATLRSRSGK
jgi:hypothetical protein